MKYSKFAAIVTIMGDSDDLLLASAIDVYNREDLM